MLTISANGVLSDNWGKKDVDLASKAHRYLSDICELKDVRLVDIILLVKKCEALHDFFNPKLLTEIFEVSKRFEALDKPAENGNKYLKLNKEFYFNPASNKLTIHQHGCDLWIDEEYVSMRLSPSSETLGLNIEVASEARILRETHLSVSNFSQHEWFLDMPEWTLFEIINASVLGLIMAGSDEDKLAEIKLINDRINSKSRKTYTSDQVINMLNKRLGLSKSAKDKKPITDARYFTPVLGGNSMFYGLTHISEDIDHEWLASVIAFIQDDVLISDFLPKAFGEKVVLNDALKNKSAYEYRFLECLFRYDEMRNGTYEWFTERYDAEYKDHMPSGRGDDFFVEKNYDDSNDYLRQLLLEKDIKLDWNNLKTVDLSKQKAYP